MTTDKTEPSEVKKIPNDVIKRPLKKPLITGGIIAVIAIAKTITIGETSERKRSI